MEFFDKLSKKVGEVYQGAKTKTEEVLAPPGGGKMRSGAMSWILLQRLHPTCQGSSLPTSPRGTSYPYPSCPLLSGDLTQPTMPFFLKCFSHFKFVDHTSLHPRTSQATPFSCLSLDPPSRPQSLFLELPTALPLACFSFLSALAHMALNTSFMLTTHFCSPNPDLFFPAPCLHVGVHWASCEWLTTTWSHLCQRI